MPWYFFVTINVVVFSLATIYQRIILKGSRDPVVVYVVSGFIAGLLLLVLGVYKGFEIPDIGRIIPNLLLMAVLAGMGNMLIFQSLKRIDASEYTVLFSSRAIWSVLAAILFLHESFSLKQIMGGSLIILSVFIVSWKKKTIRLNEGEMLTLAAAFFIGLAFINDSFMLNKVDLYFYLPLISFLPATFALLTNYKKFKHINKILSLKDILKISVFSLLFCISVTSTYTAYELGHNAAQIAVLNQTSIILIVFLGIIFLKERNHLYLKLLGAIISLIGVFLVR